MALRPFRNRVPEYQTRPRQGFPLRPSIMAERDTLDHATEEKDGPKNETLARRESSNGEHDETSQERRDEHTKSTSWAPEPPSEKPGSDMQQQQQQYSVFTTKEKRLMITAASVAGFFSPLSSTIYFPALNTIAAALNVSASKINLTVTSYVIFQGIAPMMIAGFSDTVAGGRLMSLASRYTCLRIWAWGCRTATQRCLCSVACRARVVVGPLRCPTALSAIW